MIVDPDFFEHWRTKMLIDALGKDQMAPMYVMRIWAHCQSRRATSFIIPAAGLKALCRFEGDAALLETSLIDAGFIERDGLTISAPEWAEHNAGLIANWENGKKGGRPKKAEQPPAAPETEPGETHSEPTETQPEPIETEADPIRLDKIRQEQVQPLLSGQSPDEVIGPVVAEPAGKPKKFHGSPEDMAAARWMFDLVLTVNATAKQPPWDQWANDVRLMRELDGRTHTEICGLFRWAKKDAFWAANVQSPHKLREKWDMLVERRGRPALDGKAPDTKFTGLAGLDRTSDLAAQAESMARHGVVVPEGEVQF